MHTRAAIEQALTRADMINQVEFEDTLEIGALVLSSTPAALTIIEGIPEVEMVVPDGFS